MQRRRLMQPVCRRCPCQGSGRGGRGCRPVSTWATTPSPLIRGSSVASWSRKARLKGRQWTTWPTAAETEAAAPWQRPPHCPWGRHAPCGAGARSHPPPPRPILQGRGGGCACWPPQCRGSTVPRVWMPSRDCPCCPLLLHKCGWPRVWMPSKDYPCCPLVLHPGGGYRPLLGWPPWHRLRGCGAETALCCACCWKGPPQGTAWCRACCWQVPPQGPPGSSEASEGGAVLPAEQALHPPSQPHQARPLSHRC